MSLNELRSILMEVAGNGANESMPYEFSFYNQQKGIYLTVPKGNVAKVNIDSDLEKLRDRVTAFCNEAGYQLSPQADAILRDIINMKRLTGDYYCPCQPQRLPETVCVCQPVRNGLVDMLGACFCNLIISRNKE